MLSYHVSQSAFDKLADRGWLFDQYVTQDKSTRTIASFLGCGKKAVLSALRRQNIVVGKSGVNKDRKRNKYINFIRQTPTRVHGKLDNLQWMTDNFIIKNRSIKEISIELDIPTHCIQRWTSRHKLRKSAEKQLECSKRRYLEINGYSVGSVEACRKRMTGRRGVRITTKFGNIWCHSNWEKQVAEALDRSAKVKMFFKDNIKIPYKFGNKDHLFFVDFQVVLKTGKTIMIEVKAEKLVGDERTKAKLAVLYEFAKKQNYDVLILTGKNRLNINLLLQYI